MSNQIKNSWGVKANLSASAVVRWIIEIVFYLGAGILAIIGALTLTAHNELFILYYNRNIIDVLVTIYGIIICIMYVIFTIRKPLTPVAALGAVLYMIACYIFAGHYGYIRECYFLHIACAVGLFCCIASIIRFMHKKWQQYYEAPCLNEINNLLTGKAKSSVSATATQGKKQPQQPQAKVSEKEKTSGNATATQGNAQPAAQPQKPEITEEEKARLRILADEIRKKEQAAVSTEDEESNEEEIVEDRTENQPVPEETNLDNQSETENLNLESQPEPKGLRHREGSRRRRD